MHRVEYCKVAEKQDVGDERRARRAAWPTRKIGLRDDHEEFDRESWSAIDPSERVGYVFALSEMLARMKGFDGDKLRLQRAVARVQRRGR